MDFNVTSNVDLSKLGPNTGRVYLDAEITGEGQRVELNNGDEAGWTPPPAKIVMPDWSQIKAIRRYFGRTGYEVYPAWVYHPSEKPRLLQNSDEAMALGIFYRNATPDERSRYGIKAVWDWRDDCKWRPEPHGNARFDPANPGTGKTVISGAPNPVHAQNAMIEALIPAVVASVTKVLKADGPAAPAHVDAKQWDEFLAFQAWKKTQEVVEEASAANDAEDAAAGTNALNGSPNERDGLEAQAASKGVKVDGRWSNERLKAELAKAA